MTDKQEIFLEYNGRGYIWGASFDAIRTMENPTICMDKINFLKEQRIKRRIWTGKFWTVCCLQWPHKRTVPVRYGNAPL